MSRLGRFIPGALLMVLVSMVWATTVRAASISASPNPCPVAFGQTACTSVITWTATNVPQAQIWFNIDGGTESLFACGNVGTQNASWIQSGHTYGLTRSGERRCG